MALAVQTMAPALAAERVHQTTERVRERPAALPALTGLRFVAALWVVLHHTAVAVPLPAPLRTLIGLGYQGVDLFFVLSGFVLAYSCLDARCALRGGRRAFYVARVARVYPLYLLALGLAFIPSTWLHPTLPSDPVALLTTLLLVQSWLPRGAEVWNIPAWSLAVEAFFYLLFPLLARRVARLSGARLLRLALACGLALLVAPLAYLAINPDHVADPRLYQADAFWQCALQFSPLLRVPEFVLGLVAARLFLLAPRRLPWWLAPLLLGAALALAGAVPYPLLRCGLLAPVFALAIYTLAGGHGPLAGALRVPAVLVLGEASYALYLLHYPLAQWMAAALGGPTFWLQRSPVYLAIYLGLVALCALLAYRLVECPARRAIRGAGVSR